MDNYDTGKIIQTILTSKEPIETRLKLVEIFLKFREEKQKVKEVIKYIEVNSPCPFPHQTPCYPEHIMFLPASPIWVVDTNPTTVCQH